MELLDVVDEENNLTGKKEDKDIIHQKGLWHREIAILIENEKGEYLIQKRSATKKQAPNKWCLTAGHVKAGEEYIKAAIREAEEEIGIDICENDLIELGMFKQPFQSEKTTNNNFTKYYYYATKNKIEDYTIQLEELSEIKYISFVELENIVKYKNEDFAFSRRLAMMKVLESLKNIDKMNYIKERRENLCVEK